ncbi:hypothetical protein [Christiangramia sp. LLG6405-1]|uniref:hypothetical protein n=1 Tax=Christiangramia sp. LLG6405-1 TaxID=3160832 RepID=UPI003866F6C1
MAKSTYTELEERFENERITVKANGLKGNFICLSGKSGDFWVSVIPSLNTSGYGSTEEESKEDLKYNLDLFCEDLFALDRVSMNRELSKLGWSRDKFFKKRYSSSYVDENGVLQNFDSPKDVKKSVLETA